MGSHPSTWGTNAAAAPPSPTHGSAAPNPQTDLTAPGGPVSANGGVDAALLVDNTSTTQVDFPAGPASVEYQFDQPQRIQQYTLTSAAEAGDPSAWTLEGSSDGLHWTVLDQRSGESFTWRQQTRAFTPAASGSYRYYRVDASSTGTPIHIAEIELLGTAAPDS
jgi:hypothetical protein